MYRSIATFLLLASTSSLLLPAQTADIRSSWVGIGGLLVASAAKLPEADYSFRPTPDVRTFAQLVGHVADSHFMFCGPMMPPLPKPRAGAEKLTSKAELLSALKDSVNFCSAALDRTARENNSSTPVSFFGRETSRTTLFWTNISHSFEHYGNIVTYLRLKNIVPPSSDNSGMKSRIHYDLGHGQSGPRSEMAEFSGRGGFFISASEAPLTTDLLKPVKLLYLRPPTKEFTRTEKDAVISFVKSGGSLLLVVDEERRQALGETGVNDIIEPFGMRLTPDTPYLHNCGAIAKKGEIHREDREVPYSGGRAVEGGTPFAYQLDSEGKPARAFAAWKKVENGGGRIIVMGEGMASLFLGEKNAKRLSGAPRDPANTVYWGSDSAMFMEEVIAWLLQK